MKNELDKLLRKPENSVVLSAKEICQILRVASQTNVLKLGIGEFEVEFCKSDEKEIVSMVQQDLSNSYQPLKMAGGENVQKQEEERALLSETIALREMELEQMRIMDPARYEELISQGELENDRSETEDDLGAEPGV